jgi:4-hydroxy-2-oxoheptanedioate aldolase
VDRRPAFVGHETGCGIGSPSLALRARCLPARRQLGPASLRRNRTKERLCAGETLFGCWLRYPDAGLVEFVGYQGYDFIVFDGEHGLVEPRDCEAMTRAAELREVTPIVRVPWNNPSTILRFLDTGVQGVHVPMVQSADDAEAAVSSAKYAPHGARGLGSVRAADYGQVDTFSEYVASANEQTLVAVHVETAEAAQQARAIALVDGVDVLFVGPTDLSASMRLPGQPDHPEVQEVFDNIASATEGTTVALGTLVSSTDAARRWRARGARYLAISLDPLLREASREFLGAMRA